MMVEDMVNKGILRRLNVKRVVDTLVVERDVKEDLPTLEIS